MTASSNKGKIYTKEQEDEIVLRPYKYITERRETGIYDLLPKSLQHWLNIPEDKYEIIYDIGKDLMHTSFIIDDVLDNSPLKMGKPSANEVYGSASVISTCLYTYADAVQKCALLNKPEAYEICLGAIKGHAQGQAINLYWRENGICPSEEQFLEKVKYETTAGLLVYTKLMQLFSESEIDYTSFYEKLSVFFQIHNDFINLNSENYQSKKGFCDDLREGKMSFPIIHALRIKGMDPIIMRYLQKRSSDFETKKICLSLIKETDALEYTKGVLERMEAEIREEIKKLGGNPVLENFVDYMNNMMW